MVFSSMIFLWIFLPVTMLLYGLARKTGKQELQNILLLCASIFFYSFGEPAYVLLLLLSGLFNYLAGLAIDRADGAGKKAALAAAVLINLGLLGYFKYYDLWPER